MQSTINATIAGLAEDDLVYRYHADDGVAGGEGGVRAVSTGCAAPARPEARSHTPGCPLSYPQAGLLVSE
jgi:hypothetical protein